MSDQEIAAIVAFVEEREAAVEEDLTGLCFRGRRIA
jgi:hypothetical protein